MKYQLIAAGLATALTIALVLLSSQGVVRFLEAPRNVQLAIFLSMAAVALALWIRLLFTWRRRARG